MILWHEKMGYPGIPGLERNSLPRMDMWWWWSGSCARAISVLPCCATAMASSALAHSRIVYRHSQPSSVPPLRSRDTCTTCCLPGPVSRRRAAAQLLFTGFLTAVPPPPPSLAARRGRKVVPPEDYVSARKSAFRLPCVDGFVISASDAQILAKLLFSTYLNFHRVE